MFLFVAFKYKPARDELVKQWLAAGEGFGKAAQRSGRWALRPECLYKLLVAFARGMTQVPTPTSQMWSDHAGYKIGYCSGWLAWLRHLKIVCPQARWEKQLKRRPPKGGWLTFGLSVTQYAVGMLEDAQDAMEALLAANAPVLTLAQLPPRSLSEWVRSVTALDVAFCAIYLCTERQAKSYTWKWLKRSLMLVVMSLAGIERLALAGPNSPAWEHEDERTGFIDSVPDEGGWALALLSSVGWQDDAGQLSIATALERLRYPTSARPELLSMTSCFAAGIPGLVLAADEGSITLMGDHCFLLEEVRRRAPEPQQHFAAKILEIDVHAPMSTRRACRRAYHIHLGFRAKGVGSNPEG